MNNTRIEFLLNVVNIVCNIYFTIINQFVYTVETTKYINSIPYNEYYIPLNKRLIKC